MFYAVYFQLVDADTVSNFRSFQSDPNSLFHLPNERELLAIASDASIVVSKIKLTSAWGKRYVPFVLPCSICNQIISTFAK